MNFIQQQILHAIYGLYYTDLYGINYVWNDNTKQYDVAEIPGVEITAQANTQPPTVVKSGATKKVSGWLIAPVVAGAALIVYLLFKK